MHNAHLLFTWQLDVVMHELWKSFFYLGTDVSVVKADKNDAVRLERSKNEPERMEEYIEFVFPEADVSVVKAVKYYAIRLERLKNEPERVEEHLNFKKGSTEHPGCPVPIFSYVLSLFLFSPIFKLKPPIFPIF